MGKPGVQVLVPRPWPPTVARPAPCGVHEVVRALLHLLVRVFINSLLLRVFGRTVLGELRALYLEPRNLLPQVVNLDQLGDGVPHGGFHGGFIQELLLVGALRGQPNNCEMSRARSVPRPGNEFPRCPQTPPIAAGPLQDPPSCVAAPSWARALADLLLLGLAGSWLSSSRRGAACDGCVWSGPGQQKRGLVNSNVRTHTPMFVSSPLPRSLVPAHMLRC